MEEVGTTDRKRDAEAAVAESTARSETRYDTQEAEPQTEPHKNMYERRVPLRNQEPPTWTKENNWTTGTRGGGGNAKGKGK